MRTVAFGLLVLLASAPPSAGAQSAYAGAAAVARGDQMLKSGRYRQAELEYATAAAWAGADASLKARAIFGRALAGQQGSVADSGPGRPLDSLLAGYLAARRLDSTRLFAAASNNAGLLLRAEGRHREALAYFLDAGATADPSRPYFLVNAGRELERLERPDSAGTLYRQALEADRGYGEARQALLQLYGRRQSPDSLLALSRRWGAEAGSAEAVNDALVEFLRAGAQAGDEAAGRVLVALVENWGAATLSPRAFDRAYRERLTAVARRYPGLSPAIAAVEHAYSQRDTLDLYVEPASAEWWHQWRRDSPRRKAWSSCLRSLGDRYNQGGSQGGSRAVAASYYEAAVGLPKTDFAQPWLDLDALLPLGAIYVSRARDPGQDPRGVERLTRLTDQLFMGKGAAYGANDLRRIRAFHMTLGHMYADQKQWGDSRNPRSAIFQLDRMRQVTARLRDEEGADVSDPPQLVEQLARGYAATGDLRRARALSGEAKAGYERLGRRAEAARIAQWASQLGY